MIDFKFKIYYQLADENIRLQKAVEELKAENDSFKVRQATEYETAAFSIHWDRINAVSIERNSDDDEIPHTVVGFIRPDGEIGEWFLYCSFTTHQALVAEFREWKNKDASQVSKQV